ncbi:hypothetical protein GGI26_004304 [Coemansia sp. RSA 1358]|nr:hypothetical protein GGI26_004304 [Coemansia sp. RSA 1358]
MRLVPQRSFDSPPYSPVSAKHSDASETHYIPSTESLVAKEHKSASRSSSSSRISTSLFTSIQLDSHSIVNHNSKAKQDNFSENQSHLRLHLSFIGLFFTIFLSGLDQTVTSTILTRIADDFKALDRMEWVPTIFMLCSTCLNIISGRIADIFGRFSVLLFSLIAFIVGTVLSASARTMTVFIVARGISGIACGGMLNLSIIIISDIVPIERRGKYLGFLQICFGVSNAAGPLIGGLISDRLNWRVAFFGDMIMGVITIVYLAVILRLPRTTASWRDGVRNLDYAGVAIVIGCISCVIVGLNVGGTILSWSSPATIACLVSGCVLLGAFVIVELKFARLPLVPMWVFTVRDLVVPFAVTFLCGMAMFAIIFFMPVYFSAVFGASAMSAGLLVLPFGIALSISSFVSGYMLSRMAIYRQLLRVGPAIMGIGVLALALLNGKTSRTTQAALLIIPGIGMGNVIVSNVIAAQAAVDPRFIATVTPLCEFFLSIGGVIGVAVFGAVHRNRLSALLAAVALNESHAAQTLINEARRDVSVVYASNVSLSLRTKIADSYAHSMGLALWAILPFLAFAFGVSMFLRKDPKPTANPEEILMQVMDD